MPSHPAARLTVLDPADGSLVGELDAATAAQVDTTVAAARKAAHD